MKQRLISWFTPAPDSFLADHRRRGKSLWGDAVHILWSVWIFATPLFGQFSWRWLLLVATSYPLFLLLYAQCLVAPRRRARAYALGLILLAAVMVPLDPCGLTYFVFGCVMLRACRTRLWRYLSILLAVNAGLLLETWLIGYAWQAVISIPLVTLIIATVIHVERNNQERENELRLSHEQVRRLAAIAERERIGRDLHDLLGHTLSLITLKLELARRLRERGDAAAATHEADEAERVARHALAEVRAAVTGIRSTDLAAELAAARLLLESSGAVLDHDRLPADLPVPVERALALIVREAITNVARHAGASHVSIRFERDARQLRMEIQDDGRGGIHAEGNGLAGMRERVRALGGKLQIDSPHGHGSRIALQLVWTSAQSEVLSTELTAERAA